MKLESIKINSRPCPFCGSTDIHLVRTWFNNDDGFIIYDSYLIRCGECLASTGSFDSIEDAYNAWEKRASDHVVRMMKKAIADSDVEERIHEYLRGKHDQD